MSRRVIWSTCGLLLWLLLALTDCAIQPGTPVDRTAQVVLSDAPRRSGFRVISVFLPPTLPTRQIWLSLKDDLSADFDLATQQLKPETTPADIARELSRVNPSCVVLIGNRAVNLYRKYQQRNPGPFPPAVVVMASFLDEQLPLLKNATGIAYEIPGITTFVNLRKVLQRPVERVGVVHRALFSRYLRKQRELATLEKVQIVAAQVPDNPRADEIASALERLIKHDKVDAIWVLNDNALLKPELIPGWLTVLHENPIAVVVGVSTLVDARVHFGSFAMLPDHGALGAQTSDLILRLADEGWLIDKEPAELPISVEKVVDLPWLNEHFEVRAGALDQVDRIVK